MVGEESVGFVPPVVSIEAVYLGPGDFPALTLRNGRFNLPLEGSLRRTRDITTNSFYDVTTH